jgi:hypothetical protein
MHNKLFFLTFLLFGIFTCRQTDNQYRIGQSSPDLSNNSAETRHADSLDYDAKIREVKVNLDGSFIIEQSSFFVVASNLGETETNRILQNTIDPAVECFYNDYFKKKPDDVTTILLFKNDSTYRLWAKKLYNDDDLSRFGYYKPDDKVMLMNISTGTGTLVHELTHALVRYDFPDIPAWFNEGLGSLYERSSLRNGIILGYVNWRLPDLQDAIKDKSYTSLEKLINLSDEQFYGERSGFNYAQARYFCMFLQERNLLKKFYKTFRDNNHEDPTGKETILSVLAQDMKDVEKEFLEWARGLSEQ